MITKAKKEIIKLDNLSKRNENIYKEYASLWATGMREALIIEKLAERFFLSNSTLYRIILKQSRMPKQQVELF